MPVETEGQVATTQAASNAPSGGGAAGAGGGGSTPVPATGSGGIGDAIRAAGQAAAAPAGGVAAGQAANGQVAQPAATGQAQAAPQSPADIAAALQGHPGLLAQFNQVVAKLREDSQWADYARRQYQEQQQGARTQQAGHPPAAAAQEPANPFGIPPIDRGLFKFLSRDDKGQVVALPGAPPMLAAQFEAWSQARDKAQDLILDDPRKALAPLFDEWKAAVLAESRTIAGGTLQQAQQTAYVNQFVDHNKAWLYQADAAGNPLVNPLTGKRALSDVGQMFYDAVGAIDPQGQGDPARVQELAMNVVRGQLAARQGQAQQQAAQAGQQAAQGFVQRAQAAAQQPAGQAAQPAAAAPFNAGQTGGPPKSLRSRMMAAAQASGIVQPDQNLF